MEYNIPQPHEPAASRSKLEGRGWLTRSSLETSKSPNQGFERTTRSGAAQT
jgi:hypothetical protein